MYQQQLQTSYLITLHFVIQTKRHELAITHVFLFCTKNNI